MTTLTPNAAHQVTAPTVDPDVDSPGFVSMRSLEQRRPVKVVRDVYKGTLHLRSCRTEYLPRWGPKEDRTYTESEHAYRHRVRQAKLFNGVKRTVHGLTGMVFRKPIQLDDDVPEPIREHLENIDLAGRSFRGFVRDAFEDKVQAGHGLILVDWHDPGRVSSASGRRTRSDQVGARPFWTHIRKEQVIRFRTESVDGKTVLMSFAYEEEDTVVDGTFGEKDIVRIRQYELDDPRAVKPRVTYRSWIRDADESDWTAEESGKVMGSNMDRIPLVADYALRTGFMTSEPPLLDLAIENIGHYQLRSDRDHSLHVGSVPIWVITGMAKEDLGDAILGMGTSIGMALPNHEAKAEWVETSGAAYEATRLELQDIEQRMAALGLSLLVRKDQTERTAEQSRNERAEHDSELAKFAHASEEAFTEALALHAKWMGLDKGGSVALSTDFDTHTIDAQTLKVLVEGVGTAWSLDTLWDILEAGEMLPDGFDREQERKRLQDASEDELRAAIRAMRTGGPPGDGSENDDPDEDGDPDDGGDDE